MKNNDDEWRRHYRKEKKEFLQFIKKEQPLQKCIEMGLTPDDYPEEYKDLIALACIELLLNRGISYEEIDVKIFP